MKVDGVNNNGQFQNANAKVEAQKTDGFKSALDKAVAEGDKEKLREVAEDFESIMVNYLLKSMRSTIQEGGLFEKSHGREIFESMFDEEISKVIAKSGNMGFADIIYNQMSRNMPEDAGDEAEDGAIPETKSLDLKG